LPRSRDGLSFCNPAHPQNPEAMAAATNLFNKFVTFTALDLVRETCGKDVNKTDTV
jgi:hypothetical protein